MKDRVLKYLHDCFFPTDEDWAAYHKEVEDAKIRTEKNNVEMLSKYCPTVGGDCRRTCINFEEGTIVEETGRPGGWVFAGRPRCKLWKR